MRTSSRISIILLFLTSISRAQPIAWQDWSPDVFHRATREHKFVLVDLGTQWCHWCHVMDVQTYADARVQKLIAEKYIAVKTDADARPDLGNRYEDYGWPATVVFNATGGEIVKRQGFLAPDEMASMLQAIIDDPTPGPSVVPQKSVQYGNQSALSQSVRDELLKRHLETYDSAQGSWGRGQKFLDWDNTEWAMRLANRGKAAEENMARQTLASQLNLVDPAWGGVYQYSTDDWHHPHFEKIMQMQSENLRIYSLAFAQWHDPAYLNAAQSIHHYLTRFLLSPDGGFFTSQDADLIDGVHSADYFALTAAQRTERGIPRIDQHQYARENGWAIRGLAALYEATGDESALSEAKSAAKWALANRTLPGGGFSHDQTDAGGPYLSDTLYMGQAFLEVYQATGDRANLRKAAQAADFISADFVNPTQPGLATSDTHSATLFAPSPEFDENVNAARFLNLLAQYSGRASDAALAKIPLRYIATPDVALTRRVAVGGLLLADDEQAAPALHITIVGPKSDATALALFRVALQFPSTYKRVEWYDPAEGPLRNSDVSYPRVPKPAAYFCTATSCSRPVYTVADFQARLQRVKN